jgi:hypothetical protein
MIPSISSWLDEVGEKLLEGRRIVVRGAPNAGKSFLAGGLVRLFGATAVADSGRAYSEAAQSSRRETLLSSITNTVDSFGSAQVVFDDYHLALRRSQGGRLQSTLVSTLIDGEYSRDIGAIFFSRFAGPIHIDGRGSPLISRCEILQLPRWNENDLLNLEQRPDELITQIGSLAANLDRLLEIPGWADRAPEQMRAGAQSILDDLTAEAARAIELGTLPDNVNSVDAESLVGLVEPLGLTAIALGADLPYLASQRSEGWPATLEESAARFARLLAGHDSAVWVDRYLFKDLVSLRAFMEAVRRLTQAQIMLLGTLRIGDQRVDEASLRDLQDAIPGLKIKVMRAADRRQLHDRHLAFTPSAEGWVLPTADVILAAHPPGSAVASKVSRFGIDYREVWAQSVPT